MTDQERIAKGQCVSPMTTERCSHCVDRCEASIVNQKKIQHLRQLALPLAEYLRKNHDPHTQVVVTDQRVTLMTEQAGGALHEIQHHDNNSNNRDD